MRNRRADGFAAKRRPHYIRDATFSQFTRLSRKF